MRTAIICVVVMGIGALAGRTMAGAPTASEGLSLKQSQPWSPEAMATPVARQAADGEVTIEGNGTHTCCGGWQFYYTGVRGGQAYRIRVQVQHQGLGNARDSLVALVLYDQWRLQQPEPGQRPCNYLLPKPAPGGGMFFEAVVVPPEGATSMTVRYVFRWSEQGRSRWSVPQIEPTTMPEKRPVKVCVVSTRRLPPTRTKVQPLSRGLDLPADVAQSVDTWGSLILTACQRKPDLIVTPEVVIGGKRLVEGSVAVPGPATRPFETIARQHHVYLVLGTRERAGDAFYNSAVLVGPAGKVVGVYRKVHLATSEGLTGLSAGTSFPVFDTPLGRIGCLICMDTTVCESARMLGLAGADFICFPIMGDLRADRWSPGPPIFNEERWKAIMRTRALDNQLCMVVARNEAQGSCIIDRKGDFLAWNEGNEEVIEATLPADDGRRVWDGTDFREVTYLLRRPHLYGPYLDESGMQPLHRSDVAPQPPAPSGKPKR
jgi:predicted amidohydrolase